MKQESWPIFNNTASEAGIINAQNDERSYIKKQLVKRNIYSKEQIPKQTIMKDKVK
jgi:hypothetical protein